MKTGLWNKKCFARNPPHDAAKQPDNLSTVNSQCLVNKFTCKFVRRKLCRQHERPSPWPALWEALIRCNLEIPQREIQSIADQSLEAIYQLKVVLSKTCVLHLCWDTPRRPTLNTRTDDYITTKLVTYASSFVSTLSYFNVNSHFLFCLDYCHSCHLLLLLATGNCRNVVFLPLNFVIKIRN